MTRVGARFVALLLACTGGFQPAFAAGSAQDRPVRPTVVIPRVDEAPAIEDFLDMKPGPRMAGRMLKVTGFTQTLPRDGEPVSQATDAYLAYDSERIYIVTVAFDAQPELVRARMTPREKFSGDDKIDVFLDTFHDERRAYGFTCNPLGVQMDGRWTEGGNFDSSFNAMWQSKGRLTDRGFVVWMAIPFKSLRFPAAAQQQWGLVIIRWIPRNNENSAWPWVKGTIDGRLNQGATMVGIEGISPGRERLRPNDFTGLPASLDFSTRRRGFSLSSQHVSELTFTSSYTSGRAINLVPPRGSMPGPADSTEATMGLTARPNRHLLNETTYVLSRLRGVGTGERIFSNHIVRSRWNWQFNPELALRVILQYDAVFASPSRTRLETSREFNVDVLFTYLLNPWTALHVGYNGNRQNIALQPTDIGSRIVRAGGMFEDARQFFVKFSYLLPL